MTEIIIGEKFKKFVKTQHMTEIIIGDKLNDTT